MATIPLSFGTGGAGSDDATATLAQVLSPYTAITSDSNDEAEPGTMADKSGTTSTAAVSESGSNIKMAIPTNGYYDTAAFLQALASTFGDAAAADVLSGKTFTSSAGLTKSGTISSKAAATYYTSASDQEIASGQYLSGKQTIKGVTTANIASGNILRGKTIKVGDSGNAGRIANITGSNNVLKYTNGTVKLGTTRQTLGASNKDEWYTATVNPGFTPVFAVSVAAWSTVWKTGASTANYLTAYDVANNGYSTSFTGDWTSSSVTVYGYHISGETIFYWIFGY